MSTEASTTKVNATKLTDKYNRYVVLVYKLLNEFKNSDVINEDVYKTMLNGSISLFQEADAQKQYLDDFFEGYKGIKSSMTAELRAMRKPVKEKKKKDPSEPPKKRGPKKKEIVDNRSEEEKLIDSIVAAAQSAESQVCDSEKSVEPKKSDEPKKPDEPKKSDESEKPKDIEIISVTDAESVTEVDNSIEESEPIVECVVEVIDKPKMQRKRKSKKDVEVVEEQGIKTPVLTDDELDAPENVPKPKKTTKTPKTPMTPETSKTPTQPPPAPKKAKKEPAPEPIEVPKMESFDDLDEEDYEEEVVVRRWSFEGKNYLKDDENNVYDCETQEEIGKYDPVANKLHIGTD